MDKCFQMDEENFQWRKMFVVYMVMVLDLNLKKEKKSQDDAVLLLFKDDFSCIKSMPHKQNQNLTRRNIVDFSKNQWE